MIKLTFRSAPSTMALPAAKSKSNPQVIKHCVKLLIPLPQLLLPPHRTWRWLRAEPLLCVCCADVDIFTSRASHLQACNVGVDSDNAETTTEAYDDTKPPRVRLRGNFIDRKLQANIWSPVFTAAIHRSASIKRPAGRRIDESFKTARSPSVRQSQVVLHVVLAQQMNCMD